jgi:hypothetical protein
MSHITRDFCIAFKLIAKALILIMCTEYSVQIIVPQYLFI